MSTKSLIRVGCPGSNDKQSTSCQGMKLPHSVEAKISQFGDDTTVTCRDVNMLRENKDVVNKFNEICCLKFNKKN